MKQKIQFINVKVIKRSSELFYLQDLKNNHFYLGKLSGSLKNQKIDIIVGDFVLIELKKEKIQLIFKLLPRKNYLLRPRVANLEKVFFVQSLKDPKIDWFFFLKIIISICYQINCKPIIVFTKNDLMSADDQMIDKIIFLKKFFSVISLHQKDEEQITFLKTKLVETNAFIGRSGVGKSTLLNRLDISLNLKTKEISQKSKLGKHQTTTNTYFLIDHKLVADTPGFSRIELAHIKLEILVKNIPFFEKIDQKCHFKNCLHFKEPKCFIKEEAKKDDNFNFFYLIWIELIKRHN